MSLGPVPGPADRGVLRLERRALAKVNLDLRVLAVRADGYHELATVFQSLALHDTLHFERLDPCAPFVLTCTDPSVPADDRNLVHRAAARLWRAAGRDGAPSGVRVDLVKGIPAQAGLGGGSADAAVALAALSEIWAAPCPAEARLEVAAALGADVPYFLTGGLARGLGRGDRLEPWPDLPALEVVLVLPAFGIQTADAFAWYDATQVPASAPIPRPEPGEWPAWWRQCRNDLEGPVFARHPALASLKERLRATGAPLVLMSGSGSTLFAIFEDAADADRAAGGLSDDPGVKVVRTRTVGRAEYLVQAFGARHDGVADRVVGLPGGAFFV